MRIFTVLVFMAAAAALGQTARLGDLGPDSTVVTNAVAGGVVVESDPVALPVAEAALATATNALALAAGALQADATNGMLRVEADTLATVTGRGGTTTRAVTIGSRGVGAVGVSSFANGMDVVASGPYSHAEGIATTAIGEASHAEGYYTTASGEASHAEGVDTTASGGASHASGFNAVASNITAFAWQGVASVPSAEPEYGSHGAGTYNLNPVGGLAGLWIGETNMAATLSGYATTGAVAAVSNWVESIRGVHADIASNVVYHVVVSNGHWLIQEVE